MAKLVRSYRISEEVDALLKAESARLSTETKQKVSEADVIEMALVAWLGGAGCNTDSSERVTFQPDRRSAAESAIREVQTKYHDPLSSVPPVPRRAESVAQRKAREAKEHAEKLAEADTLAREAGRNDIEYDLENVPRQSALLGASRSGTAVKHHYEVQARDAKPLSRPHGGTEAKRRRDQS